MSFEKFETSLLFPLEGLLVGIKSLDDLGFVIRIFFSPILKPEWILGLTRF